MSSSAGEGGKSSPAPVPAAAPAGTYAGAPSQAERAHRGSGRRVPELRIPGEIADENDAIDAGGHLLFLLFLDLPFELPLDGRLDWPLDRPLDWGCGWGCDLCIL